MHDQVEACITGYIQSYAEKPEVSWLEQEYKKPKIEARRNLDNLLQFWNEFRYSPEVLALDEEGSFPIRLR
jgi:hypothetical protein